MRIRFNNKNVTNRTIPNNKMESNLTITEECNDFAYTCAIVLDGVELNPDHTCTILINHSSCGEQLRTISFRAGLCQFCFLIKSQNDVSLPSEQVFVKLVCLCAAHSRPMQ